MISHELAKELKDAGFPQDGDDGFREVGAPVPRIVNYHRDSRETNDINIPTLSELIEACERDGYFDFRLQHDKSGKKWFAHIIENSRTKSLHAATIISEGLTPEDAVARLWLAM
jgi:hypothetical protein